MSQSSSSATDDRRFARVKARLFTKVALSAFKISTPRRLRRCWVRMLRGCRHSPSAKRYVYIWADSFRLQAHQEDGKQGILVLIGRPPRALQLFRHTAGRLSLSSSGCGKGDSPASWPSRPIRSSNRRLIHPTSQPQRNSIAPPVR